eukprot:gene3277-3493_t
MENANLIDEYGEPFVEGNEEANSHAVPPSEKPLSAGEKSPTKSGMTSMMRSLSSAVFKTAKEDEEKVSSKKSKEEVDRLIDLLKQEIDKPYDYHYWVRTVDASGTIYYYNTMSGETSWLPICSICAKPSEQWCIQCNTAFCQRHLVKKHQPKKTTKLPPIPAAKGGGKGKKGNKGLDDVSSLDSGSVTIDTDGSDLLNHEWSAMEVPDPNLPLRPRLEEGQEYCLLCALKIADVVCGTCWDPYCNECFKKTHRIGTLKRHVPLPQEEVRAGWFVVRASGGNPEYYVNGETGESTYEKPRQLMSELEGKFYDGWKSEEAEVEVLVKMIEETQFELEQAKYDKDRMIADMTNMTANFKVKAAAAVNTGVDIEAVFGQSQNNQSEYRQILLNPSDRKRGQARTQYIKSLLEAPFPT